MSRPSNIVAANSSIGALIVALKKIESRIRVDTDSVTYAGFIDAIIEGIPTFHAAHLHHPEDAADIRHALCDLLLPGSLLLETKDSPEITNPAYSGDQRQGDTSPPDAQLLTNTQLMRANGRQL